MVVNLSVGKGEYDDRYEELCEMADRAQDIKDRLLRAVDEDTEAFNEVIAGIRMPKDTAEQMEARSKAIRTVELAVHSRRQSRRNRGQRLHRRRGGTVRNA